MSKRSSTTQRTPQGGPAFDARQILTDAFIRLRRSGLNLGVDELLDALKAVAGGLGAGSPDALRQVARLLWCNSPDEMREFDIVWATVVPDSQAAAAPVPEQERLARPRPPQRPPEPRTGAPPPSPVPESSLAVQGPVPEWHPLPIRAPFTPALTEDAPELHAYWPVSRRFMVYAWRYLRRPIPDGPVDVLDVDATVAQAARQGFFLAPVYRRRERNHAHLVLLLDQGGSMVPFHRFTRDMVETARYESDIERLDVYYFQNVPAADLFLDPRRTAPVPLDQVLAQCTSDTSLLVVSDAGAARGYRHLDRIRATTRFLSQLRQHTALVAWLNPMPADRWPGTSAQIIAHLAPMFQMDPDDFSNAIDVVRGQPLSHYR
jgi:uncharacterized protein with von Willebrand factor type A (vWA) domain